MPTATRSDLTADELKNLVRYDPESGLFFWAGQPRRGVRIGTLAGNYATNGCRVRLNRLEYKAHRLAWLYVHGQWPSEIDHINGNPSDNRLCNLREASRSQNLGNTKCRRDSSSGLKGVSIRRDKKAWRAHFRGEHLGSFPTKEDAHEAYKRAADAYFGEFARYA